MSIEQVVNCRSLGQGEDLVLIHGWGVSGAVWNPVVEALSLHFKLHIIDIPGFGESDMVFPYTLDNIVSSILNAVPDNATWCGWSLGGLIATYATYSYPDKVSKLIQVCSPIKFVSDQCWNGVEAQTFELFKEGIEANPSKTLVRFMNLQASGSFTARKDVLLIKKQLLDQKVATKEALLEGLELLNETDLRDEFSAITQPSLSIFGRFDSLVPIEASTAMSVLNPKSQQAIFELSSHAPFITEQDHFCEVITAFLTGAQKTS